MKKIITRFLTVAILMSLVLCTAQIPVLAADITEQGVGVSVLEEEETTSAGEALPDGEEAETEPEDIPETETSEEETTTAQAEGDTNEDDSLIGEGDDPEEQETEPEEETTPSDEPETTEPETEPEPVIRDISLAEIKLSKTSFVYTGSAIKPAVVITYEDEELEEGTDFTLEFGNNTNVGTASVTVSGTGQYEGSLSANFKITAKNIKAFKVTGVNASYVFSGKAVAPAPVVKDGTKVLKKGTDYTLSYTNNKALGTAKVKISGKGNYAGSIEKSYKLTIGTGLYKVKGVWKYYEKGKFKKKNGLVKRIPDGKQCYVEKGIFKSVTGLIKSDGKGKWRYVKKGVFTQATGLVKRVPDGKYFFVENGIYKKESGAAPIVGKSTFYYVKNGARQKTFTGLAKNLVSKKWMYFEKGIHKTITGVVSRYPDGKNYYAEKGYYKKSTGLVKRISDGKLVYVENGAFSKKTGIVARISNGKFYFIKKGIFNKSTGYAQRLSDGKWLYVYNGEYKGATMSEKNFVDTLKFAASIKTRYWNQYPYNCGYMHEDGAVSWDCLNLVKSIINGWKYSKIPGTFCNNFSKTGDCTEWGLISQCGIVSTDFKKLNYTAVLYMPGHIGTYIGHEVVIHGNTYNVIECTSRWGGGVFYTYVDKYGGRYNHKGGTYLGSNWTHHGKMTEWLAYSTKKLK